MSLMGPLSCPYSRSDFPGGGAPPPIHLGLEKEGASEKRNCNCAILAINCKQYIKMSQYSESNIEQQTAVT